MKLALACAWVKEIFHLNVTKLYLELGTMTDISTWYTHKEILKLNVMTLSSTLCWYTQETSTSLCLGQRNISSQCNDFVLNMVTQTIIFYFLVNALCWYRKSALACAQD